jgi:hypothetical protein
VSKYSTWNNAGRPLTPCLPVEDLVAGLKAAYPAHADAFSWYANESHYQATPPGDHTPYSADAWPESPNPEWVVFATDVMVNAVGGEHEAQRLFDYWLAEAKSGRAPWIKYLIWQAKIYDVRHGWRPQSNSGHFDHIHVSVRTDHEHTSLTGWDITGKGDEMTPEQSTALTDCLNMLTALCNGVDQTTVHDKDGLVSLTGLYERIAEEVAKNGAAVDATAVAAALAGDETFLAKLAKAVNDDEARRLES